MVADHVMLTERERERERERHRERERERAERVLYPLISLKVERLLCKKDLRQAKRIAK